MDKPDSKRRRSKKDQKKRQEIRVSEILTYFSLLLLIFAIGLCIPYIRLILFGFRSEDTLAFSDSESIMFILIIISALCWYIHGIDKKFVIGFLSIYTIFFAILIPNYYYINSKGFYIRQWGKEQHYSWNEFESVKSELSKHESRRGGRYMQYDVKINDTRTIFYFGMDYSNKRYKKLDKALKKNISESRLMLNHTGGTKRRLER